MRIEVEIGMIEIDALPEGVSAEGLRAAVVVALAADIRAGAVPGLAGQPADAIAPAGPAHALGARIVRDIYGRLTR
jgi:hypothetical protein